MSYMRGDLLTRMRKLVKGLARPTPAWLKAMEEAPPVTFPLPDGKVKQIELPEDVYVKKFFKKNPDSLYHDAVKISSFDPPPARVFAWRVLELKGQGVNEDEAMAVADMEYQAEKTAKKAAYKELKKVARLQGKKPPPNPYPSAVKEIQAEEKKYVRDRFFNRKILEIVQKMKEEKAARMRDQQRGDSGGGRGNVQPGGWFGGGGRGQPGGWQDNRGGGGGGQSGGWFGDRGQ
ncbi:aspartate, glycine, lysine and serine-rich protein [Dioscorea cayenensis subsp. rotundata]|uniref:Small ribosomal subunit protein mS23 n=1 Tax=Dioscorea cayennensis subsp. rotundata TaxID=55577 RepID=A0AB40BKX8_DIOCR|nr:aspartate, glycine, lysine and serine-rich protein [Dioscorea cayenensis subsp. rotundata]